MPRYDVSGVNPFSDRQLAALVEVAARKLREEGIFAKAVHFSFDGSSCTVTVQSRYMSVTLSLEVRAIDTALRLVEANEQADWN